MDPKPSDEFERRMEILERIPEPIENKEEGIKIADEILALYQDNETMQRDVVCEYARDAKRILEHPNFEKMQNEDFDHFPSLLDYVTYLLQRSADNLTNESDHSGNIGRVIALLEK